MSDQIYLSRIRLSQFRSFAALDLSLLAEPGVLVVHGSNGLGKSSLFTGLEWALTDSVDHFREANGVKKVGNYLARWREDASAQTSVTLDFSDGGLIERVLASPKATTSVLVGNQADITGYLRAADWSQSISALQQYLLLTHFLGQSAVSRLTNRDSSERFDILKEAAQSSEIEAIGKALHGNGNTVAVRAFARRAETFEREAAEFEDLLDREASLWEGARASGAIDDVEARTLGREIFDLAATSGAASTPPPIPTTDILSPDALDLLLQDVREAFRTQQTSVDKAKTLVADAQRHRASLTSLAAGIAETDAQLKRSGEDLERTLVSQIEKAQLRDAAVARANIARQRRDRLLELRDTRQALDALLTKMSAAEAEHQNTTARLVQARTAHESAKRRAQLAARLQRETTEIAEQLSGERAMLDQLAAWDERQRSIHAMEGGLSEIEAAYPGIDAQLSQAEADHTAASQSLDTQKRAIEQLKAAYSNLSNAVVSIAAHLPAGTCRCPVCDSKFDTAAVLRGRVAGAAERLSPALFEQETALAELARQREVLQSRVATLKTAQAQIRFQRSELATNRAQNAELLSRVEVPGQVLSILEMRTYLSNAVSRSERRRARKLYWLAVLLPASGSADPLAAALREREDSQRALDRVTADMTGLRVNIEQVSSDLRAAQTALSITDPEVGEIAEAIATAEQALATEANTVETAREQVDAVAAHVDSLNATIGSATARFTELRRQQAAADTQLQEVVANWRSINPAFDEPREADVQEMAAAQVERASALGRADDMLQRLRQGRSAWAAQVAHRDTLEQLRLAVDGPASADRDELRAAGETLRAARGAAAASIRATKEIARTASTAIFEELEGFNADYIRPLDFLMKQINQAILCDPRVGIDLHVKKKKIEQSAVKTGEVPSRIGDLDPILVHSEGQMAALSASMLCAASLTFPWSRWRALVLDDPLQHNDAIHAAAFADLMSSLVAEKGYQILISTHDLGQAEFLRRKFDSRGIPCATLNLLGTGREGVEWDFQSARSIATTRAASPG